MGAGMGGSVQMVSLKRKKKARELGMDINEGNARALITAFSASMSQKDKEQPLISATAPVSDYEAQMAAINAQIAMNQYLMMRQMEQMERGDKKAVETQRLMMEQMKAMNGMVNDAETYDPSSFALFQQQWQLRQQGKEPVLATKESTAL